MFEPLPHIQELENISVNPKRLGLQIGDTAFLDMHSDGLIRVMARVRAPSVWMFRMWRIRTIGTLKPSCENDVRTLMREGFPLRARFVAIDEPHMTAKSRYSLRISIWAPTSAIDCRLGRLRKVSQDFLPEETLIRNV
jgi:hypothetical protein